MGPTPEKSRIIRWIVFIFLVRHVILTAEFNDFFFNNFFWSSKIICLKIGIIFLKRNQIGIDYISLDYWDCTNVFVFFHSLFKETILAIFWSFLVTHKVNCGTEVWRCSYVCFHQDSKIDFSFGSLIWLSFDLKKS